MGEVEWFQEYAGGRVTWRNAQTALGCSRSTFFRRLRRFRSGGPGRLTHRLRGRPKAHWSSVRRQVLSLYEKEPSLFCSHFYRRNRWRLMRRVAYSTVRHWLRAAGALRRFPRGTFYSQEQVIRGRRIPSRILGPGEHPPTWQPRRLRRNLPWQVRDRWRDVWLGWERPVRGSVPHREDRARWQFEQAVRRTMLRRAYRTDAVEHLLTRTPYG